MTSHIRSVSPRRGRAVPWLFALACAGGLSLSALANPANAQAPVLTASVPASAVDFGDWTGRLQNPAFARKEAGAALVQGRRECARERSASARSACLQLVNADHAAMLKRINNRSSGTSN